jgi:hypothetical protein
MRNSLFIFKPPNQREDIIDKCRECVKDRDTAPTRPNSVYPHHFSSHKKVADQNFISRPSHKKFHFKNPEDCDPEIVQEGAVDHLVRSND